MSDSTRIHQCEASDSFVHPFMKLSNGKDGNGEGRLFISSSKNIFNKIVDKKKIKILFDSEYIQKLEQFVSQETHFKQPVSDRCKKWKEYIKLINGKTILIESQNGNKDINRNYIGQTPHRKKTKNKTNDERVNIRNWDIFRKSIVPTKTTFVFDFDHTDLTLTVFYNKNIHIYNKPSGCSFISIDFFDQFSLLNNIEIQHAMNGTEHKERKENGYFWPVDGYHNCNIHKCCGTLDNPCFWNNYVFEFQGTYWHKDKKNMDLEKKCFYIKRGYNWFEINENEWNNRKKVLQTINNSTKSS